MTAPIPPLKSHVAGYKAVYEKFLNRKAVLEEDMQRFFRMAEDVHHNGHTYMFRQARQYVESAAKLEVCLSVMDSFQPGGTIERLSAADVLEYVCDLRASALYKATGLGLSNLFERATDEEVVKALSWASDTIEGVYEHAVKQALGEG